MANDSPATEVSNIETLHVKKPRFSAWVMSEQQNSVYLQAVWNVWINMYTQWSIQCCIHKVYMDKSVAYMKKEHKHVIVGDFSVLNGTSDGTVCLSFSVFWYMTQNKYSVVSWFCEVWIIRKGELGHSEHQQTAAVRQWYAGPHLSLCPVSVRTFATACGYL